MFVTYSGVVVDPANVRIDQINLIDIAHHLTNINRFGGALEFDHHYSVAEHSLLLTEYVIFELGNPNWFEIAKYALMHDASEYILGDINSGLKAYLHDYKKLESKLSFTIQEKYNIRVIYEDVVKSLDKRILLNEVRALREHHYQLFRTEGLLPLEIDSLAINDDDYGIYQPGTVRKQVVYDKFLEMCKYLKIED